MTALTAARNGHASNAFMAFLTLEVRRAFRNRRYVMFAIGFPVVFYLLYTGVLSGASPDDGVVVGGLPWRTFFLVSMATYGAIAASLGGAVIIAQERTSGWARQLRVTPLPAVAFVAGKVLVSMLVTVPAIVAVCIAGVAVNHVDLPAISWLQLIVTLAVGSLPFAALGLLIGYLFDFEQRPGRDDAHLLQPVDPWRTVGPALVVPRDTGYHRTRAAVVPSRRPRPLGRGWAAAGCGGPGHPCGLRDRDRRHRRLALPDRRGPRRWLSPGARTP